MASLLKVNDLENLDGGSPTLGGDEVAKVADKNQCTAWVNFDGTDGTIRDSFNINNVDRNDVGDYTISFEVEMDNSNYSLSGMAQNGEDTLSISGDLLTTDFTVNTRDSNGNSEDSSIVTVQVIGGK